MKQFPAATHLSFPRKIQALLLLLLLALLTPARAQDVTTAFTQPTAPLTAGSQGSLWLYCMNNSAREITHTFPLTLEATLNSTSKIQLTLNPAGGAQATVPPGGFARREYLFEVPSVHGAARLDILDYNPVTFVVQNSSPVSPAEAPPPPEKPPEKKPPRAFDEFLTKHLSTYEPIYFMVGSYPAAEFQFSLKYRLFTFAEENNFMESGLDHFYFAYTQTSFWDLFSRDPAFYDSSYKPSLFLYYTNVFQAPTNAFFHLDLQPGAEHESNGKGLTGERSIYTGYLQPTATFQLPGNFSFMLQPRARAYFLVGQNNPDIADYRGYADLLAAVTWSDPHSDEKIQLAAKYTIGDAGRHAGYKVDLRFNLACVPWFQAFNPTIQLQYFTGYGQTLLQYNESSKSYRAGLCLWFF